MGTCKDCKYIYTEFKKEPCKTCEKGVKKVKGKLIYTRPMFEKITELLELPLEVTRGPYEYK